MIKRISLLLAVALMAVTMLAATAAPSFAGVKSECQGTWIQSTKTCQKQLGQSDNTRDTSYQNAGNGGNSTSRVNNPSDD